MLKKIITILASAFIFTLTGCGASGGLPDMNMPYSRLGFGSIESAETINSFAVVTDTNTAVLSCDYIAAASVFTLYENVSVIKEQAYDTVYSGLCYGGGQYYSFDTRDNALVMLDKDFHVEKVLLRDLNIYEVKNLSYLNDKLYFLLARANPVHEHGEACEHDLIDESGYMDFKEAAFYYDLNTGELKELKMEGITAQSAAPDGLMYYYRYDGKNYTLNRFNDENGGLEKIRDMNDTGYIFGFAFYDQTFIHAGDAALLKFKDFSKNNESVKQNDVILYFGSDLQLYNGNLLFVNRLDNRIEVMYLGGGAESGGDSGYTVQNTGTSLVIGADIANNIPFSFSSLNKKIGMNVSIYEYPLSMDETKIKLMAGDSDVDIYIFYSDFYTPAIKSNKIFVPLNGSEVLSSYVNGNFDYINDYFTDNGNIWGVPIGANTLVTWYVPKNFKKFDLTYDDVKMFDPYMETSKRLKGNTGEQEYFNMVERLHPYLHKKYDINYNDFKNNNVNYNTEIYRHFYEALRNNWVRFVEFYSEHPYFNNSLHYWFKYTDSIDDMFRKTDRFDFDEDMVIFNTSYVFDITFKDTRTSLKNWRAFPAPMLSQENEKSPITVQFALLNPHGKNIAAAMEYLEFLVRNRNEYINKALLFMTKDKNQYAGLYDIKEPCFNDLYDIFLNGGISEPPFWTNEYQADIDNYQKGLMTIEEVTANLQRKAEMALFE